MMRRLGATVDAVCALARRLWARGVVNLLALLLAWLGLSFWVAQFCPRIWPLAVAVLCLSAAGYRWCWQVVWVGLFSLSQSQREGPNA